MHFAEGIIYKDMEVLMEEKKERRKFPRIKDENIAVKLSGEGFNTISQSLDVSASGIYCKVDRHIPLMSRLRIVLSIPGKKASALSKKLDTEGVVVREQAVKKDGKILYYDIAIFFNALTEKERNILMNYIDNRDLAR
jgi:hypothetical protein